MEIVINLVEYNNQCYDENKQIGFMRFDFADGSLANSFVAGPYFNDCSDKSTLQLELNEILFEQLGTWEQVGDLVDEMKCLQEFTADDTAFYFAETDKHQFLIRLMPSDVSKIFAFEK